MNKFQINPGRAARWIPALLLLSAPAFASGVCTDAVGRLESAEGSVAVAGVDSDDWQMLTIGECIPVGSGVRVSGGRAVFRLANETLLRTAGETQLRFSAPTEKRWIHLIDGLLHLITRTPRDLEVESEYVNAGVKGTEFIVSSDRTSASGQVIVLEGEVVASNSDGSQAITGGGAVVTRQGEAPRQFAVPAIRDAVQWTLHYPPLPRSSQPDNALTHRAADQLRRGETAAARATLQQALSQRADDRDALALQAVTEIAIGNIDRAAELLARIDNDDATVLVARSYLQQAQFDLPAALDSAEKAAELIPSDATIQARVAELALMNDDTERADIALRRALQLEPRLARAHALKGFLQLQRLELDAAEQEFVEASRLDSSDPLARLGLGLIEIRRNRLEAGRQQLELAVALDPGQSLLRSYLGKAYQLEQRNQLAGDQYALARQFDRADPTPWLYGALLAQSQNRPFEALQMIEESIALNDNRAVYRSRLQLEGDEATRTASQADIYRDLGFTQLAQRSAARAVASSPGSYGGHRQLAESYADDPQYDAARASEVLQAQLLQPLSATPIQPLLAETNLLVTNGAGPGALGYRNYDALFVRERPNFQIAGLGGSNDTGAGQVSVSGVESRLAYAVDYYHYETQGYRENNDARYDVGAAYAGLQVNEKLSLMLAVSQREEDRGEITEQLFEELQPFLKIDSRLSTATLGGHLSLLPTFKLMGSLTHREREIDEYQRQPTGFGELFNYLTLTDSGDQAQIQAQLGGLSSHFQIGADWSETERKTTASIYTTDPFLIGSVPPEPQLYKGINRYRNGYGYWSLNLLPKLQTVFGLSYADLNNDEFTDALNGWYPKIAAVYDLGQRLSLRATYFKSLTRPTLAEQTLEPTQLGEFNQIIDDREGTEAAQYGLGINAYLGAGHHVGIEWLERELEIPFFGGVNVEVDKREVDLSWSWSSAPWAINLSHHYDFTDNPSGLGDDVDVFLYNQPSQLTTQRTPLELLWQATDQLKLVATITYFDQNAKRPVGVLAGFDGGGNPRFETSVDRGGDSFSLVDLSIKYHFWHSHIEVLIRCNNITDESFRYQNTNLYDTTPQLSPYLPERNLLTSIKLSL